MLDLEFYPFQRDEAPASYAKVVLWWESRRIAFNVIVGATGVVTIAVLMLNAAIHGGDCGLPDPLFGILGIIAYGIMANICYTAGEIGELAVYRASGAEAARVLGRKVFTAGLALSEILTIAPAIVIPVLCLWSKSERF